MPSNLKSGIRPQISHFRPQIRLQFSIQPTSQPQIRPPRPYIKSFYPRSGPSDPKSGPPHPISGKWKPEKIALCGIIGHWLLRGRCPTENDDNLTEFGIEDDIKMGEKNMKGPAVNIFPNLRVRIKGSDYWETSKNVFRFLSFT